MHFTILTTVLGALGAVAIGLTVSPPTQAGPIPHVDRQICKNYVTQAERRHRIPLGLLHAIAVTESDYHPWAVNIEGRTVAVWSRDAALQEVQRAQAKGIQNVSIGCMQVLVKYHAHRVGSPRELLEPSVNVPYAATYLRELYEQTGDWWKAVALYHSGDRRKQAAYLCRVYGNYATVRNIPIDEGTFRARCGRLAA